MNESLADGFLRDPGTQQPRHVVRGGLARRGSLRTPGPPTLSLGAALKEAPWIYIQKDESEHGVGGRQAL